MKKNQQPSPEPVPVNVVCSLCGEPWHMHAEVKGEVSTLECIRLLKAKAATVRWYPTFVQPVYPQPIYPYRPYWQYTTTTTSPNFSVSPGTGGTINCASTVRTPSNVAVASIAN